MNQFRRVIGIVFLVVALASIWWWILPPQLGGRTTLFTTRGISMEPYIVQGDLAVLHKKSHYKVGDVVAFHADSINAISLHRIIAIDPTTGALTTKGDNNDFDDLDHPTQKIIIGGVDHLVHGGGRWVQFLTNRWIRIVGVVILGFALWAMWRPRYDEREKSPPRITNAYRRVAASLPWAGGFGASEDQASRVEPSTDLVTSETGGRRIQIEKPITFASAVGVALVSLATLFTTMMINSSVDSGKQIVYSMKGKFNYSADAGPDAEVVYPSGKVTTGDPIYLAMVNKVHFTFAYNMDTQGKFRGSGQYKLDVVIKGSTGWSHILPVVSNQTFDGSSFTADSVIDLQQARDIVDQAQALTKTTDNQYIIAIKATVDAKGKLGNADFDDSTSPELDFDVNRQIMTVGQSAQKTSNAPPGQADGTSDSEFGLSSSKGGTVDVPQVSIENLTIVGKQFTLSSLRVISVLALIASIVTMSGSLAFSRRRDDDDALAQLQSMIQGNGFTPTEPNKVFDFDSIESLTRAATAAQKPISRSVQGDIQVFYFELDGTTYRFSNIVSRDEPTSESRFGIKEEATEQPRQSEEPNA